MVKSLQVAGRLIELDEDLCLVRLADWDEQVAQALAEQEGIELQAEHWLVLYALRDFYQEFDLSPPNRALVKYLAQRLGKEVGNSLHLNSLFKGTPAKLAARLAGLPKPANCF
ncbi:TusE/DsrC/DsvC family sulfur relay protein [Thiopseudomonas acetoxidans]|uniref:Sulfurtransferase n=1 Tax=Thiopseudomonas acetoxidans TaxID=3041622 RepID=A0ABT7SQ10_9GAMM|nr:TusE/DsrC/DsvC family sulfur relay protein [Thiopseudomonas sp. CY1220]MDM7858094.1 TusE/DsrC/DsvC family sulfur relay protein [Thiopseudomonas sp. CY1220]